MKRLIILLLSVLALSAQAARHTYTLVIDAGHGGKDAGACANGAKEKDINLSVALAFGSYVERNCKDVKVIYTRKTDVFIPLHERADIANRNKADVFISIHTNSVASKRPIAGLETYTMGMRRSDEKLSAAMRENEVILIEKDYQQNYAGYDPRSPESMILFEFINESNMAESVELARLIQKYVCATAGRPNKGVKQDAFLVLRETSMPACLVELGYITTPSEKVYLTNKSNVDAMGRGLYQAFVSFRQKHDSGIKVPFKPEEPKPEVKLPQVVPEKKAEQPTLTTQQPTLTTQQPSPTTQTPAPTTHHPTPNTQHPTPTTQDTETPPIQPLLSAAEPETVFKVQFLASGKQLKEGAQQFKGLTGIDCYQEGGLYKYTIGNSSDLSAIQALRRQVAAQFPQAFIVAFRGTDKLNTQQAIADYKRKQKK